MTFSQTWRFTRLATLSALLGSSIVSGQDTSSAFSSAAASSTASTSSNPPQTHTVSVAYAGFTFTPDVVQADVGDYIEYDFYPANHSVARAQYEYPCIPYEDTGVDLVGFFSGFKPVDAILSSPPTFTIRVNDTDPIFYYCTAPGSCINYGMVGVINPNATTSLSLQKQLAMNSTFMLQPGEPWPAESTPDPFSSAAGAPTSTTTSSASATSTSAAAATSSAAPVAKHSSSLSSGAIAGIAIGAAAVAILAAALLYLCGRQSRRPHPQHHPIPQGMPAPYDPHMSYVSSVQPGSKHMTTVAGHESGAFGSSPYASPALPGYVPAHDPAMSPPMRPYYAPSDALSPAGDVSSQRSESPSQMMRGVGVPPYTSMAQQSQPIVDTPPPQAANGGQVHEMYAPAHDQQQGGFMSLLRGGSMRKSGGVERYG